MGMRTIDRNLPKRIEFPVVGDLCIPYFYCAPRRYNLTEGFRNQTPALILTQNHTSQWREKYINF